MSEALAECWEDHVQRASEEKEARHQRGVVEVVEEKEVKEGDMLRGQGSARCPRKDVISAGLQPRAAGEPASRQGGRPVLPLWPSWADGEPGGWSGARTVCAGKGRLCCVHSTIGFHDVEAEHFQRLAECAVVLDLLVEKGD